LTYGALKKFGVPVIINFADRAKYIEFLQTGNTEQLANLIEEVLAFEQDRQKQFVYQNSLNIEPTEKFDFDL